MEGSCVVYAPWLSRLKVTDIIENIQGMKLSKCSNILLIQLWPAWLLHAATHLDDVLHQ